MTDLLLTVVLAAEKAPDVEGRDIVLSMLVVGLIFLGVVAIGSIAKFISHNRRTRE